MKRKGKIWLFVVAMVIFALAITTVTGVKTTYGDNTTEVVKSVSEIRFGIDISGGVEVTFSPVIVYEDEGEEGEEPAEGEEENLETPAPEAQATSVTADQLNAAQAVMEQRLANLGITDYELFQDAGNGRLILRFPWKSDETDFDPESAIQELAATALLTFREGAEYDTTTGVPTGITAENIILQGDDITKAEAAYDSSTGGYIVALTLSDAGAEKFSDATERLYEENGQISIWLDNTIISAPSVNAHITGNEASITGNFTAEEAQSLANTINAGSLPFAMRAESYSTISSALGASALKAMVIAGIVALILVIAFMVINYKLPGVIASISLLGQTAGTLAFMSGYFTVFNGFTLTLPGIAGIILAVGMGVDANVITAERIREELRSGKKLDASIRAAFKRGLAPIVDGNITVLIVAAILIGAFGPTDTIFARILTPFFFAFGAATTGTIYSFGYTLLIGVLLNFVFGVVATRIMIVAASKFQALRSPVLYGGPKPGTTVKEEKPIDFLGNRKKYFAFSGALIALIIAASFILTPALDIEFKGGSIVSYSYTGVVDMDVVQETIEEHIGTSVTLQEGTNPSTGTKIITVSVAGGGTVSIEQLEAAQAALEEAYPDNNVAQNEVSNVSASMGREFLLKCLVAVVLASVLILLYIGYRFRKIGGWLGGLTAIAALLHDLVIVYGVFVLCRFNISGNFIAALLVILGYSINNTVVIYDRVRENRALYGKTKSFTELVNLSINESLNRSLKTSFTTIMALVSVCVFALVYNLDSIFTFALPITIGLVAGTYSSLCVAGPLWVTLLGHKAQRSNGNKKTVKAKALLAAGDDEADQKTETEVAKPAAKKAAGKSAASKPENKDAEDEVGEEAEIELARPTAKKAGGKAAPQKAEKTAAEADKKADDADEKTPAKAPVKKAAAAKKAQAKPAEKADEAGDAKADAKDEPEEPPTKAPAKKAPAKKAAAKKTAGKAKAEEKPAAADKEPEDEGTEPVKSEKAEKKQPAKPAAKKAAAKPAKETDTQTDAEKTDGEESGQDEES